MAQPHLPASYSFQFPDISAAPSNYYGSESHLARSPNSLETRRRKIHSSESLSSSFHPYSPQQNLRKRNSVHNMMISSVHQKPNDGSGVFPVINEFSFTMQHPGMITSDGNSSSSAAAAAAAAAAFMPTGMDFTQLMNGQFNQNTTANGNNAGAPDFSQMLVTGHDFQAIQSPGIPTMAHNTAFNPLATPGSMHARSDCGSPAAFSSPDPNAIMTSGQHTPTIARTFLGMRIQDDEAQSPNLGFNPAAGILPGSINQMTGHPSYPIFRTVSPAQLQQPMPVPPLQTMPQQSSLHHHQQQQQQQQIQQQQTMFPSMLGIPFPNSFSAHPPLPPPIGHPSNMMMDPQQFQRNFQGAAAMSPPESPGQIKTLFTSPGSSGSSRIPGKDGSHHSLLGPGNIIPEEDDNDGFSIGHPNGSGNHLPLEIVFNRPRMEVNVDAIRPAVKHYLSLGGGVGVGTGAAPEDPHGERTVVLMTARVAQKSYGAEKRFLCPPPTVMLLGSQWWTAAPGYDQHGQADTAYHPPKVIIHIPGDSGDQPGVLDWCNAAGQPVLEGSTLGGVTGPVEALPVAGRCVAKHLYINDADEKRKRVEISVRIQTAAGHQLGKFDSRPIKVISKPSKKRQSVKNLELCIHHGTTVSLFNRVRSQTVSTKYLGVSSNATTQRWHCPGTFNPAMANTGDAAACFVARTDGWDPFVIWLVEPDPLKRDQQQLLQDQAAEAEATPIGYPPPPGVAMHPRRHVSLSQTINGTVTAIPSGAQLIPVHYNQLVVLQCLTTGMVSPVMRVRKVEKGSMVTGGAEITSLGDGTEMLGDPVSQLHKVAFEIYQPKPIAPPASSAESLEEHMMYGQSQPSPLSVNTGFDTAPGTYLACLGDVVGVHPAVEGTKRLMSPPHTPKTPTLAHNNGAASNRSLSPQDARDMSGNTSSVPGSPLWPQQSQSSIGSASPQQQPQPQQILQEPIRSLKRRATQPMLAGGAASGGIHKSSPPVKSIRKVSSLGNFAVNAAAAAAAATAAGGAYYADPHHPHFPYGASPSSSSTSSAAAAAAAALAATGTSWNEDVGDASVWTIVGTECVRYTFYHPNSSNGNANHANGDPSNAFQFQPQLHLAPVTPVPSVHRVTITTTATAAGSTTDPNISLDNLGGESASSAPLVLLSGENFTSDLSVWFGDRCSAQTEWRGRELIACYGPEPVLNSDGSGNAVERQEVPLLLVRSDGVIYKTGRTLIV
ncbi:hypothetical protein BDF19DRAFT_217395 [Syncephalis fuscata]|nr:hypothetical protein BDF19DRAFT_217395 [Syncephalis fuscata]